MANFVLQAKNLPYTTTDTEIAEYFISNGVAADGIGNIFIVGGTKPKGEAFISFENISVAEQAFCLVVGD